MKLSKKSSLIINAYLVLGSLLFCIVALEVVLRFELFGRHRYRTEVVFGSPDSAKHRVLILGDSFVWPYQPQEALSQLLYNRLPKDDVSLINTAFPGMCPYDYLRELKRAGPNFKPTIVLLSYYIGNDLYETRTYSQRQKESRRFSQYWNKLRAFLKGLYVYRFYRYHINVLSPGFIAASEFGDYQVSVKFDDTSKPQLINGWYLAQAQNDPMYLMEGIFIDSPAAQNAWKEVVRITQSINKYTKSLGAKLLIVVFPRSLQINDSHVSFFKQLGFTVNPGAMGNDRPQRLMNTLCQQADIACLDLLPYFRAELDDELYRKYDDHLNDQGNRLSAKLIAEFISEHLPRAAQ